MLLIYFLSHPYICSENFNHITYVTSNKVFDAPFLFHNILLLSIVLISMKLTHRTNKNKCFRWFLKTVLVFFFIIEISNSIIHLNTSDMISLVINSLIPMGIVILSCAGRWKNIYVPFIFSLYISIFMILPYLKFALSLVAV